LEKKAATVTTQTASSKAINGEEHKHVFSAVYTEKTAAVLSCKEKKSGK
jgi:hypothetical protein